ncbi:two-partner secretion domain-containing protein [Scytonema millei]|uniref:Filamentous hemagglutinin N-terminal domain-containing protein n=1 Tax=Scytonema millei VB511283 TaxID=1245923 RepID=A0A9X5E194_9CYAN|nr:filamentous hemagglutinin N-terminal domain-containing protein [Scytonema millei]NHC33550.1 filamentous hemagglutinin N-terminal domain-containing protein [Scytonema millei VB511283]
MQISSVAGRWCARLGLFGAITSLSFANVFGSAVVFGSPALAQVVPDNTVGSAVSGISGGEQTITGGTRQGGNLFHSFDRFSVPTNGAAIFSNDLDIQNILSRVTGGSVSDIDGLIRANGAANLFLLNPNGIIFGPNARLDVGGSFIATTASSINFADGTQFSATPGTGAPLLTVSVPLGLQFGAGAGEIVNRSRSADSNDFVVGLQVQPGKTLGLIGGSINLEGGWLTARGGRIELGAVAAPGVVGINPDPSGFRFSFPTDLTLGDISLTNDSIVNVSAGGGGHISVNTRNLNLFGGSELVAGIGENQEVVGAVAGDIDVNAQGTIAIGGRSQRGFSSGVFNNVDEGGTGKGGNIDINTGSLSLTDSGVISASVFGTGNAGNVNITAADSVSLDSSTIFSRVRENATGNGGNVAIKARSVELTNGARLTTSTLGQGNAGSIDVRAQDTVSLNNSFLLSNVGSSQGNPAKGNVGTIRIKAKTVLLNEGTQIAAGFFANGQGNSGIVSIEADDSISFSASEILTNTDFNAVGNSSDILISAPTVSFTNGSLLKTSNAGQGNAGNITITAQSLSLSDSELVSNIGSLERQPAKGDVGNIRIKAKTVSLNEGTQIEAGFFANGQGNSGIVSIEADDSISFSASAILTNTDFNAVGNSSDIQISAPTVSFTNGSLLKTSNAGQGNAGNITITAQSLSLSDSELVSNIGSLERQPAKGDVGNIRIKAKTVSLNEGTQIEAGFFANGQGNSGVVSIEADDSISFSASAILTNTDFNAVGNSSDIQISAPTVSFTNGSLLETSNAGRGNAGNVTITASDRITFDGSSVFSSLEVGGTGRGGDITLKARSISLENNTSLTAGTFGEGDAGNVFLQADNFILLSSSYIFSSVSPEAEGNGGTIDIKAGSLSLTDGAQIIAAIEGHENKLSGGRGNGGKVIIDVRDAFSASGSSGVFTTVQTGAVGNGGTIDIKARSFSLSNNSRLNASNFGTGDAGNIIVNVRTLNLDNGGILASSESGDGGDIRLQASKSVRLRKGSYITTEAGSEGQGGNGGNITIDSPLVIAGQGEQEGNNDIFANAFNGKGGTIEINAQSIFGLNRIDGETLQSRLGTDTPTAEDFLNFLNNSSSNDVAAISLTNPSFSGTVSFNTADIDPSRDIVELPTGLVDASSLVAAGCPSGAENRFTVAGRGGLPPAPADKLSPDALLTDWATLQTPETQNRAAVETTTPVATNTTPTPPVETITEATSWQYDRNGAIILTSGDTTSSSHLKTTPTSCPSS